MTEYISLLINNLLFALAILGALYMSLLVFQDRYIPKKKKDQKTKELIGLIGVAPNDSEKIHFGLSAFAVSKAACYVVYILVYFEYLRPALIGG